MSTNNNNNEEIINTITNLDLDLVCCAGCDKKQKSDEFEEDINGDMWCADCYASLKDKFKTSYKCDADTEDEGEKEWEEIHCKCGWVTGWAKKDGDGYEVEVGSADFVKKEFPDGNWYVQCNVCAEKEKAMDK